MKSMKRTMVILMTILFGLLFISQLSYAEIFKWVDEKGTVHFTEDPATIPEKYREKVKSRTTEEDLMTPEERIKAKQQHEKGVQERQQRGKKEDEAKEQERQLEKQKKELIKQIREAEGKCEITSYSQYEILSDVSGHGGGRDGSDVDVDATKQTCVDITIQNKSYEAKIIRNQNIVAYTRKGNKVSPTRAVLIQIEPGQTHRGTICFGRNMSTIIKMELRGL